MSQKVIDTLQEEHRNISRLLDALEYQLNIFDRAERPDYEVLENIADYFVSFPHRCHHPKEDLVFAKMCERDPSLKGQITDLESEHQQLEAMAGHFKEAVQNVLREVEMPRSAFDEVTRSFIAAQRGHIRTEEEQIFPRAVAVLKPEDWDEIDARISSEDDPVFSETVSAEFALLREKILQWEAEDEALGR